MKIINKKAHFEYELGERVEAGIKLTGPEAKSARLGQIAMDGAHVKIMDGEAWIVNMQVYPYKYTDNEGYDPMRTRKLLLGKSELISLQSKMKSGRMTLVPTAMYTKGPKVKLEIALARGKKKYEKRDIIKKRELEREGVI